MRLYLIPIIAIILASISVIAYSSPKIITPNSSPLANALVAIEKLDGTKLVVRTDSKGEVFVKEVPLGIVRVTVIEWKGIPVNESYTVTPQNSTIVCKKIGKLVIYVTGVRGQGLPNAFVQIKWKDKAIEENRTTEDGSYSTELPEGEYSIIVEYLGKKGSKSGIRVSGSEVSIVKITLDVFIVIDGWALSFTEFIGLIALAIVIIILIYIILYEYSIWRRKRLVAALIPAKKG